MNGTALADPNASRAVLVGVSAYPNMPADRQLPAVANNLDRLDELLRDPDVWGLSRERCKIVRQPDDSDVIIQALRSACLEATDMIVFYYAGHGLTGPPSPAELHLALSGSYEPNGVHTGLDFDHIRGELLRATARRKVVVVDCCWSGRALEGRMGAESFDALTTVDGTAVLTASAWNKPALSPDGEPYTAFTGALIDLLEHGEPGGPAVFDLGHIYRWLDVRLRSAGRPVPKLRADNGGTGLPLARNRSAHAPGPQALLSYPRPSMRARAAATADDVDRQALELERRGEYEAARALRYRYAIEEDPWYFRRLAREADHMGDYKLAAQLWSAAQEGLAMPPDLRVPLGEQRHITGELSTEQDRLASDPVKHTHADQPVDVD